MVLCIVHHLSSPEVSEQHVEIGLKKLYNSKAMEMKVALLLAEHYLESRGPLSGAETDSDRYSAHSAEDEDGVIVGWIAVNKSLIKTNVPIGWRGGFFSERPRHPAMNASVP
jgi:hypothetical protein